MNFSYIFKRILLVDKGVLTHFLQTILSVQFCPSLTAWLEHAPLRRIYLHGVYLAQ